MAEGSSTVWRTTQERREGERKNHQSLLLQNLIFANIVQCLAGALMDEWAMGTRGAIQEAAYKMSTEQGPFRSLWTLSLIYKVACTTLS